MDRIDIQIDVPPFLTRTLPAADPLNPRKLSDMFLLPRSRFGILARLPTHPASSNL
jgi:hypothetical protein